MKNILRNSNFGFTKWCVALIAAGWMGGVTGWGASIASLELGIVSQSSNTTGSAAFTLKDASISSLPSLSLASAQQGQAGGNGYISSKTWNAATQNTAAYWEFTLTPISSYTISASSISVRMYRSSTGPASIALRSDADGYSSNIGGTQTLPSAAYTTITFSALALDNKTAITFRVYAWGASSATGTLRLGDGTASSLDLDVQGVLNGAATTPNAPVVAAATGNTTTGFTANWAASSGATKYYLDVATDSGVTVFVPNFSNLDVGNVTSYAVTGLSAGTTYYYKVRASNSAGTSASSGAQTALTTAAGTPSVTVSPTSATGLTNYVGQASAPTNYTVTGTNLGGTNLVVTASTNAIEVSTNSSTGFTNSFSLAPSVDGTLTNTVYVRISSSAPAGPVNATVSNASGIASNNFTVSGTVTQPALTLVLATNSVAENAGANATTGTVGIPAVLSSNLVVSLVSSNTAAATVPASVTITNGQTNATFDIAAVANTNSLANQTAPITASATNYTSASATLTVQNVDAAPVSTISLASLATDSYTQSFDALGTASIPSAISFTAGVQTSLAAVTGSSTLNGWYATKVGGSSSAATAITAEAGGGTSGLVYSYGAASASDRALGMLASGSNWMAIGALIKNDTGATINSIKVSFTAEFWRPPNTYTSGSTVTPGVKNTFVCAIGKVDGSTITTANFLTAPSAIPLQRLNIVGPDPVTTGAALDGNSAGNQAPFTDVVIPLQLAAGETAFVRWSDVNDAANDAGLAIDNLRMTASLDLPAADGDGAVSLANSTVSSPYTLSGIWAAGGTAQGVSVNVTPLLESTTLTSVSILVPADFGAPLVENVTSSGGATGGTPTVAGQLITVTGVSITKANPGVINIAGLSTPPTSTIATGNGVYAFTVSTAGDGGTLKAVFASPSANVLIPIGNIRDVDANGAPVDKNTIVAVEGICTAASLGATSFIQDTSYGIAIFPATTTPAFTLGMVAGRKYAVVGTLVDYNGMAEIKPASISGVVDLGVATMPTPITITVAQAKAEQYESMLVTIQGLTKDTAETDSWTSGKTITVKNSAGDAIDVRIQADSTATAEPLYPAAVTGILAQFSSATPRAATYQIMPRTGSDLSFAPALTISSSLAVYGESDGPFAGTLTIGRRGSAVGTLSVTISASVIGRVTIQDSADLVTIEFADGQVSKTVDLGIVDDSIVSPSSQVVLSAISVPAGAATSSSITINITDNDTDTTKPVITRLGANPLLIANGATYADPGATVTDNLDAERTITGSGTVNTTAAGDYTITYNATDAAGNVADEVTRTVRVAAPLGTTYSGWLNGAGASDAAFLDYVFGAATPGTLDPSLKPTVAVTGGNLVLTYYVRQGTSGLTVTPKTSADLAAGPSGWVNVIPVDVDVAREVNGIFVQQKTASVPVSGDRKFLKLEAVQQ